MKQHKQILLTVNVAQTSAPILTPKAGPEPRIHGPKIFGVRPGNPFLYTIPESVEGLVPATIQYASRPVAPSAE